jgi:hypothetical protein
VLILDPAAAEHQYPVACPNAWIRLIRAASTENTVALDASTLFSQILQPNQMFDPKKYTTPNDTETSSNAN